MFQNTATRVETQGTWAQYFCFLETTVLYVNWPPQGYQVSCQDTCLSFSIFAGVGNKY